MCRFGYSLGIHPRIMSYHWPHFLVLTPQDLFDGSNLCILEASQESKKSFLSWVPLCPTCLRIIFFWHCLQTLSYSFKNASGSHKMKRNCVNLLKWKLSTSLPFCLPYQRSFLRIRLSAGIISH